MEVQRHDAACGNRNVTNLRPFVLINWYELNSDMQASSFSFLYALLSQTRQLSQFIFELHEFGIHISRTKDSISRATYDEKIVVINQQS